MTSFDQFESCLLCGHAGIKSMPGYERHYLVRCDACRFVFCVRKPTREELKSHYGLYPRANAISEITLKRYEDLMAGFEPFRKTNNIIDVGCGDGFFLAVAKKFNWNVYGTEFTEEAVEVCRQKGISMEFSPLNAAHYPPGHFDVVTSFEVIEHINEPLTEIKSFSTILRQGGIIYITTPNFNSVSRNLVGAQWNVIEYPEHLSYYTRQTLRKLFVNNHFRSLGISTTGVSVGRIRQSGVSDESAAPYSDEELRQRIEGRAVLRLVKKLINAGLNWTGKGDSMKATFQKL